MRVKGKRLGSDSAHEVNGKHSSKKSIQFDEELMSVV
jgi:hypothetical protein